MKISFLKKVICSVFLLLLTITPVFAQEFSKDLFISSEDVRFEANILKGDQVRIYVTVHNDSHFDLSGVVKFYDERVSSFIGSDQPISVLAKGTDDVFIDWQADIIGKHPIAVRVVPWDESGDNPNNNKITKEAYVDVDSDGDGTGNSLDNDDDNDGVPDSQDAFPFDPNESKDTDGDGIGDNVDTDDDGDGISDMEDVFPLDSNESKDTDGDGVGDNGDLFPYDSDEWKDSDGDGLGDNDDPNDENHGPIPDIQISDTNTKTNKPITFNALNSRDPDGEITTFEWDFGDETTRETGVIIDHTFKKPGKYLATLTVTDDKGEYREKQIEIRVGLNWIFIALIVVSVLLIILLLGLLVPGSRFHHSKFHHSKLKIKS